MRGGGCMTATGRRATSFCIRCRSRDRPEFRGGGLAVKETALSSVPEGKSPAGADIRFIMDGPGGNMIHSTVAPGQINRATVRATVSEFWHVLAGEGEIWRKDGSGERIISLVAGVSIDIPVGTAFQYRNVGATPLRFICVSMPPWPGDDEASFVIGVWTPPPRAYEPAGWRLWKKPPVGPSSGRRASQTGVSAPWSGVRGAEVPPMRVATQPGSQALILTPLGKVAGQGVGQGVEGGFGDAVGTGAAEALGMGAPAGREVHDAAPAGAFPMWRAEADEVEGGVDHHLHRQVEIAVAGEEESGPGCRRCSPECRSRPPRSRR